MSEQPDIDPASLSEQIAAWARELEFSAIGVADTDLSEHRARFEAWLAADYHGEMGYLERNVEKRLDPSLLWDGTLRVIVARMDYAPNNAKHAVRWLDHPTQAYVSQYATGRDYHKVVRRRLAKLAKQIDNLVPHRYRAFADSAPVLEKALAAKAGLGWVGRHSLVLNKQAGSWFFLGEILTNLPLPVTEPASKDQCGACKACISVCPTDAILPNRTLDARKCISYLTIEHKGPIAEPLREAIGNRVFGCDDCQLYCPWNRAAPATQVADFTPRQPLANNTLLAMFAWSEEEFLAHTEGTAMRRVSYEQWQRNLAIALGNGAKSAAVVELLTHRLSDASPMVAEHIRWALARLDG